MENEHKILLVAEGSGGHLIPALEVARSLARAGARVKVWYAQRQQIATLSNALTQQTQDEGVEIDPLPIASSSSVLSRLWGCGQLWSKAQHCFDTFEPDVVVGFGGWVSAPVVLAARLRRAGRGQARQRWIGCVVHEQNVVMGRANRWLANWVDRVALSYQGTGGQRTFPEAVMTGMPVRSSIGRCSREQAAEWFGFRIEQPTILILGGSQGAGGLNQLLMRLLPELTPEERAKWQWIHITGARDEQAVREAYRQAKVCAWVSPFLVEMDTAYAHADVVIARAGASTIAELARCGKPAVLIPYPHAGGHQRANANMVEVAGGGLKIEESAAAPSQVLEALRRLLAHEEQRAAMGSRIHALDVVNAADRLTQTILELGLPRVNHAN